MRADIEPNEPQGLRGPLRPGDVAPDFVARSTKGMVKLSDHLGRWVVLFSHPADFTPVCTTEFVALARLKQEFEAVDCALIGLSVDSLYAHFAWTRAIETQFGVAIDFPIAEDPNMAIGRAYGMIDAYSRDSKTMRSAFFIDRTGIIRAVTSYPHNVGRCVKEMLRLVRALQAVEDGDRFAPEGWQPGDALLAPPPDGSATIGTDPDWFCRTMA